MGVDAARGVALLDRGARAVGLQRGREPNAVLRPRGWATRGGLRGVGRRRDRVRRDRVGVGLHRRIPASQALPGDLLFTHTSAGAVYHVAIYAGDDDMWDAHQIGRKQTRDMEGNITYGRVT